MTAWQAYHRRLNHVFRFKPEEVARALPWFELSARLDGSFARARAADSFCHYHRAFSRGDPLHDPAAGEALRSAEAAMAIDGRDRPSRCVPVLPTPTTCSSSSRRTGVIRSVLWKAARLPRCSARSIRS